MQGMQIWALLLLTEAFLLSNGLWGFLLWRARKLQRRLRAEIANLQRVGHEDTDPATALSPSPSSLLTDAAPDETETAEPSPNIADLSQVVAVLDDSSMDESMGRLEETSKTLQQHVEALQAQPTLAQQDQEKLAALQQTLQQMTGELDTLRYTHTRMQRDLHNKKLIVMRAVEESELLYKQRLSLQHSVREFRMTNARLTHDLEGKERLLQHFKAESQTQQNLRGDVQALKSKLAGREADVERLQAERDLLAEEYSTLSKEYERVFSNFLK